MPALLAWHLRQAEFAGDRRQQHRPGGGAETASGGRRAFVGTPGHGMLGLNPRLPSAPPGIVAAAIHAWAGRKQKAKTPPEGGVF